MSKCGTNHSTNQDVVCHGFNSLAYKIAVSLKLTVTSQAALESPARVWLTPCSHCSQELFTPQFHNNSPDCYNNTNATAHVTQATMIIQKSVSTSQDVLVVYDDLC